MKRRPRPIVEPDEPPTMLGLPVCIDVTMPADRIELRRVEHEGVMREVVTVKPRRMRRRKQKRDG